MGAFGRAPLPSARKTSGYTRFLGSTHRLGLDVEQLEGLDDEANVDPRLGGGLDGDSTIVEPGTGWQVTFNSRGTDATGDATVSNNRGESKTGSVRGGITDDGRRYNVSVDYDNGQHQLYTGRVGADGVATGATNNGITLESGHSFTSRLVCLPKA
jgi:hypothetical protein